MGGKLSGGKTAFCVAFALDMHKKGYKVISNIQLKNFPDMTKVTSYTSPQFVELLKENYHDTIALRKLFGDSILILDEIVNLAGSRKASSILNELITNFLVNTGKIDCHVIYTFQVEESQVDKIIRNICNVYGECFRCDETGTPLFFERRKLNRKILINTVLEFDFGIKGIKTVNFYWDPSFIYPYYSTEEMTLLDRTLYLKGGKKDLRKY